MLSVLPMWGLGALAEASTPRNLEEKFRAGPSEMINLLTRAEWATLIGGHSIHQVCRSVQSNTERFYTFKQAKVGIAGSLLDVSYLEQTLRAIHVSI
jgi:hypothetical protein